MTTYRKTPEAIAKLTPEQFRVTQRNGTEYPGTGALLHNHEPGIYVDIVSGEPLFASADKFESGCGWPSFTKPIEPANVNELKDSSLGMVRIEVRSALATATSATSSTTARATAAACATASTRRRCASCTATTWKPKATARTSTRWRTSMNTRDPTNLERAVLAGGCFWGMQDLIRKLRRRRLDARRLHRRRRAERDLSATTARMPRRSRSCSIRPASSYRTLLEFFFQIHDPTTKNRQGNDMGTSYRSAIYYHQRRAEADRRRHDRRRRGLRPVAGQGGDRGRAGRRRSGRPSRSTRTTSSAFPHGYTCHFVRPNWKLPKRQTANPTPERVGR